MAKTNHAISVAWNGRDKTLKPKSKEW